MNRIASRKPSRSSFGAPPAIVAKIDLTDDRQRILHSAMQRMHAGRSPMWRALGMRQDGHRIYEAAECLPRVPGKRPRYSVVTWNLADCGLSWTPAPSRAAALSALRLSVTAK